MGVTLHTTRTELSGIRTGSVGPNLRLKRGSERRRQGEARQLPTQLQRSHLFPFAVHMTASRRFSGDFLRLLYILSHRQAANYFTRMGILDPCPPACKQRRGTHFYYNRAVIGLACTQACTVMRIDIAPTQAPSPKAPSTRSRPPPLPHPSTRQPPRVALLDN